MVEVDDRQRAKLVVRYNRERGKPAIINVVARVARIMSEYSGCVS